MPKPKFYRPILYYLLLGVRGFFMLLPFSLGYHFAGFVGKSAFYLLPKEKKKVITHLKMAFPEMSDADIVKLGARNFQNYGYTLAELVLMDKQIGKLDKLITVEGREHFDKGLAAGKGLVAVSAHFGNWEMLAGYLSYSGYPGSVVARRIYYDKYNDLLVGMRAKMKLKTLYRDESPRDILKALKENRVLGILGDQDVSSVDGVHVNFFGRPAYTPSAPVRLAMRLGVPVIPCMMIREEGLKHRLIIEPALELDQTGDEEKDVISNTQKWVSIQENYIRKYPHLWVWNHKRWQTVSRAKS